MPSLFEENPELVKQYLEDSGYIGYPSLEGLLLAYEEAGYTGSLEDQAYAYLGDIGYTGALPDRWTLALIDGMINPASAIYSENFASGTLSGWTDGVYTPVVSDVTPYEGTYSLLFDQGVDGINVEYRHNFATAHDVDVDGPVRFTYWVRGETEDLDDFTIGLRVKNDAEVESEYVVDLERELDSTVYMWAPTYTPSGYASTTLFLSNNTWYKVVIEVHGTGEDDIMRIYNAAGTVLHSEKIYANTGYNKIVGIRVEDGAGGPGWTVRMDNITLEKI